MKFSIFVCAATVVLGGCVSQSDFNSFKNDLATGKQKVAVDVLGSLPKGSILLLRQNLVGGTFPVPAELAARGWQDCAQDGNITSRFLRISPSGVSAPVPANGGQDDSHLSASWSGGTGTGITYSGGQSANGTENKRSPGPDDTFKVNMPEFTYLACIEKIS